MWIPPSSLHFVAGYQRGRAVGQARAIRYVLDPVQDSGSRDFRGATAQDWALIELDKPLGRQAGFLDLLKADAPGHAAFLAGYAGLRPHVLSLAKDCGVWPGGKPQDLAIGRCSVMLGDSGAPVLVEIDGKLRVAGVLSTVETTAAGWTASVAIRASRLADPLTHL